METDNGGNVKTIGLPEGFSLRQACLDDAGEVTALVNMVNQAMIGEDWIDVALLKNEWQAPGLDLEKDTRVILNDKGAIIAYQDVFATDPIPVHPDIWGAVHLDYMDMGLGTSLVGWAIERAKDVLNKVPAEARVSVTAHVPSTWEAGKNLLEDHGLSVIRHFFRMKIDIQEPPAEVVWPEGITIHTYKHPEEAKDVYLAVEEAFQDHFGFMPEPVEEGFRNFQHEMIKDDVFDPDYWFLAKDKDQIAGFALNRKWSYDNKDTGYIKLLGVRRPWRKRGLGLALLQHSFSDFWARGKRQVALGVDGSNLTGAVRLYEKAGMHVSQRFDYYELELRPGKELARTELGAE
jgi:mycothiol synthase